MDACIPHRDLDQWQQLSGKSFEVPRTSRGSQNLAGISHLHSKRSLKSFFPRLWESNKGNSQRTERPVQACSPKSLPQETSASRDLIWPLTLTLDVQLSGCFTWKGSHTPFPTTPLILLILLWGQTPNESSTTSERQVYFPEEAGHKPKWVSIIESLTSTWYFPNTWVTSLSSCCGWSSLPLHHQGNFYFSSCIANKDPRKQLLVQNRLLVTTAMVHPHYYLLYVSIIANTSAAIQEYKRKLYQ